MKLSVVVPCRNAMTTLAAQLDALCRQRWSDEWEVLVVDNGSTDRSEEIARQYLGRLPGLQVIQSARRGAAHARNAGVRASSGAAIAFCDADDVVGDDWLTAMGNALLDHDFVASRFEVEKLNPPWLAQRLNNVQGRELRRAPYPPYLRHAGSSGLGIKRTIHERVGGFDETLLQREDTDYCFRVQRSGTPFHFEPSAVIHIRYSQNGNDLFRQARLWARYHALLCRRYGDGTPVGGAWRSYWKTWYDLLRCLPRTLSAETRPAWMKTLGTQIGLLEGSIKYGVPPACEPSAKVIVELNENLVAPPLDKP